MTWTKEDFLKSSQPDWMQIPCGVFVVMDQPPLDAASRPLDCKTVHNSSVLRYGWRDTSTNEAYFNRPRSSSRKVGKPGSPVEMWGRNAVGIRLPKYSMMRGVSNTYFRGVPLGSMVRSDKDELWRIVDRDAQGRLTVHRPGDKHAYGKIHPALGITDYFNHRKYAHTPFKIKQYDNCEWADDMSIMFPSPEDVKLAIQIGGECHKGLDLSKYVVAAYNEDGVIAEPEKKFANDWAMLEDLCA